MKRLIIFCLTFAMICSQSAHGADESIPCNTEPTNMAIDYGDVISCAIDPVGDTDIYHFNGTIDEAVTILISRADGVILPCVELIAPNNASTVECNLSTNNRIDTILDQTGTFSLLVSDWNNDNTGDYTISLERVNPVSPDARQIFYDESLQDDIDPNGDMDLFFFVGSENDNVSILISRADGVILPCIELIAPDNSTTVECNLSSDNRIDTVLDQTGTFSLLVSDWNNDSIGDYTISLQCVSGDCLSSNSDAGDPDDTNTNNTNDTNNGSPNDTDTDDDTDGTNTGGTDIDDTYDTNDDAPNNIVTEEISPGCFIEGLF